MREYYTREFRADLQRFMGESPAPYFGHAWAHHCAVQLERVDGSHRAAFLICLYFTVLVDQAMHCHFHRHYVRFQELTRYPKFCHGLSQFQHNPRGILATPIDQGVVNAQEILALLPDGMALFVNEVIGFFRDHMPEMTARQFFDALLADPDVQVPEILVMLNPATDVVVVAYRNLREAASRALDISLG